MKLAEAVFNLGDLPPEAILFAERINGSFTPESRVEILTLDETELEMKTSEVAAARAPGTEYFLEAFTVRGMVEEWTDQGAESYMPTAELIGLVIRYAQFDD